MWPPLHLLHIITIIAVPIVNETLTLTVLYAEQWNPGGKG